MDDVRAVTSNYKSSVVFTYGPVVKNPPSDAGDAGFNPGQELRSHTMWTTRSHATIKIDAVKFN